MSHAMQVDTEEVFKNRMNSFKQAIAKFKNEQVNIIQRNSREEQEQVTNKILNEAKSQDEVDYLKRRGAIEVSEKIFKSRKINELKMSQMRVRFGLIEEIEKSTKQDLQQKGKDRQLLKGLIMQGLIKLLEEQIQIRCLKEDVQVITELMVECEAQFAEMSEVKSKLKINSHHYLEPKDLGGIILSSFHGRIVCDNTLRARLDYAIQMSLPEIRKELFCESDQFIADQKVLKKVKKEKNGQR